jgi:beta-barrel assembly-enhancing protease
MPMSASDIMSQYKIPSRWMLILVVSTLPIIALQAASADSPTPSSVTTGSSKAGAPPVTPPVSIDLTPSGYKPGDPLYNDPEVKLGREAADEISKEAKFSQDKALVARVQAIGARIAAVADVTEVPAGFGNDQVMPYHYTYHVIESKEVNAFSLPGGFIYVYTGLIKLISTDDELAGVLGHETSHAAHHHVSTLDHEANKMSNGMLLGVLAAIVGHMPTYDIANLYTGLSYATQGELNNVFSEAAEEDADHTGMIFMKKAGYNPVGMLTMLERLEQEEKKSPDIELGFLQDHPLTPDRVAAATAELSVLGVPVDAQTVREADNSLPVQVTPALGVTKSTSVTVTVANSPVFTLASVNRSEADAAAVTLDKDLSDNLQMYEIKADGADLIIKGQTLVTMTDADVAVQTAPTTPELMATAAVKSLQRILWQQEVTGINAD